MVKKRVIVEFGMGTSLQKTELHARLAEQLKSLGITLYNC